MDNLENRIERLKGELNEAEMVKELSDTSLRSLAMDELSGKYLDVVRAAFDEFVQANRLGMYLAVANSILKRYGLETVDGHSQLEILEKYLDRFSETQQDK